jgi:hypothetical protein
MIRIPVLFSWLALSLGLGAVGCNWETMRIGVQSPREMNGSRPVRILVRAVYSQEYVNESYTAAADKVVNRDDSVLYSGVVYPGVPLYATVKRVVTKSMAVYVFFTTPGARWKALLDPPLPHAVAVKLSDNNIDTVRRD